MKITRITSHVLGYDLPESLGYSQQYYNKRTSHIVEVETHCEKQIPGFTIVGLPDNAVKESRERVTAASCAQRESSSI